MEPLLPSEVARLVYGYLKQEKIEDTAQCFLKFSPHLKECHQMFKANRNFNIKVNGFNLHDIFDLFGTMCSMINERTTEVCESKTIVEKLQYLLDLSHTPTKEDKCVETELNMIDKCVGDMVHTEDKSTYTSINVETNKSTNEVLDLPSFTNICSSNVSKTKEFNTVIHENSFTIEKNSITNSPCLSSTAQLLNNSANKFESTESPKFQIDKEICNCSTPAKKVEETKIDTQLTTQLSPKNNQYQFSSNQPECLQIPEATSLESMPGLSKEDRPKDSSVVIDTGELVDTFLNDQSLLEKIADTINKSIDAQKELYVQEGNILDPPILEKALDSTQSDPQIKNILDEFLIFNVDNAEDSKNMPIDQQHSIKSRLRSAKKKDDVPNKLKKNNLNIPKQITYNNDECIKIDNNIVLVHDGNIRTSNCENYNSLTNEIVLQSNESHSNVQSFNFDTTDLEQDDYVGKSNYVKIAPKLNPMLKTLQVVEKRIFPKRKKRHLQDFGIQSKFRRTNITSIQPLIPVQSTQSIIIEVPCKNSFETQTKSNLEVNNITQITEVSTKLPEIKHIASHDTPDDVLKPPKIKSMSTPRRRSTHIRCLDFSTPQPKKSARDQARSKLFCDSPRRCEKILEESLTSPLPKLQADWGSVNGFESIVKKEPSKHWDTDIREMVGAGILTSDADGRKTRKKKTPRKKIKQANNKKNSELATDEQNKSNNNLIEINESQTDEIIKSNISDDLCVSNEQNYNNPLLNDNNLSKEQREVSETPDLITETCNEPNNLLKKQKEFSLSLETPDKIIEINEEQPPKKSDTLQCFKNQKQYEFPISLETPDKITELFSEQPLMKSNSTKSSNDSKYLKKPNELSLSLETPDKIVELSKKQPPIKSNSQKNLNDPEQYEFSVSLETSNKITESLNEQLLIESNSLKSTCTTQLENNLEQSEINIRKPKNNLIQSNTLSVETKSIASNSSVNQERDYNFLKTFDNNSYLKSLLTKPSEIKLNEQTENLKQSSSLDKIETTNSFELNSPIKRIETHPITHTVIETPYKCDDAAVDVPETPISKLIREYDPSKLITPLPCTPEHYEDSLTETPLTKVFRETSYLNRPPISPFPPTPGNSMSIDTLIVPPEQECSKTSNSTSNKINGSKELLTQPIQTTNSNESCNQTNTIKPKPTPTPTPTPTVSKTKSKIPAKTKTKNGIKGKSVEAKKKQVYESVKVELFGSEISLSSSADELDKTSEVLKKIVINKKPQEEEKKSGFKPIPKRKSIQSTSIVVNDENNFSNESNTKLSRTSSLKPALVKSEKSLLEKTKSITNMKQSTIKSKKSMVHFDDPVEKIFNLSTRSIPKSNNKYPIKIQNKTNENPEQLIGLSRYLNKQNTFYEIKPNEQNKIKRAETSKMNISDSNINYSENYIIEKSNENIPKVSSSLLNNRTKAFSTNFQENKSFENCIVDENKKSNRNKSNTNLTKSNVNLDSVPYTSIIAKTCEQSYISNISDNTSLDKTNRLETTSSSHNSTINNTSCVTVGHNDEVQLQKVDDSSSIEYLKKSKVYEVITEDGEHEMVYLSLSEMFTFLDVPSELNNIQPSNSIISPLKVDKTLDVTPEKETGELDDDDDSDIHIPVTSTPKDAIENKNEDRQNRARRSPSFWEDSAHNYPTNYRDDRHRESNHWRNKNYRDNRYDKKYRPKSSRYRDGPFDSRNRFQYNNYVNIKREYGDDSVTKKKKISDKERFKHKDDKRRSHRDYTIYDERKGRDRLEDPERFSTTQRMSQNDTQKVSRSEDIVKKATKRSIDRADYNKTPAKKSRVEHQRLLRNVDVDDFLSVVHGRKKN